MLAEAPVSAEWVAGMCRTIRNTWFVPDMGDRERRAWIEGYWRALCDLPAPFVLAGWDTALRKLARRPAPAEIRLEAERLRQDAHDALRLRRNPPRPVEPEERGPVIGPEERERVSEMLLQLGGKLRMRREKRQAERPPVPERPRRRTDAEIEAIIAANPARKGQTVERFREIEEGGR